MKRTLTKSFFYFFSVSFIFPYILPELEYTREDICHHMEHGASDVLKFNSTKSNDKSGKGNALVVWLKCWRLIFSLMRYVLSHTNLIFRWPHSACRWSRTRSNSKIRYSFLALCSFIPCPCCRCHWIRSTRYAKYLCNDVFSLPLSYKPYDCLTNV